MGIRKAFLLVVPTVLLPALNVVAAPLSPLPALDLLAATVDVGAVSVSRSVATIQGAVLVVKTDNNNNNNNKK